MGAEQRETVVVGAGLAGLAAAVTLHDRGHDVTVLEAADAVGGRVRTDEVDGFLLDRGFQVLLTAYPVARRMLDYDDLDLRRFRAGSMVQLEDRRVVVGDPIRRYEDLIGTVTAPIGSVLDKARLLRWRQKVMAASIDELWRRGEITTSARFADMKFSDAFLGRFLRPLFAGITLDPELEVTSRFTEFVFRMLSEGYGAVPAHGMGMIPKQLADRLPRGSIRLGERVTSVGSGHVELLTGDRIDADAVVVAVDMDTAAELLDTPKLGWNGGTTWWFAADEPPFADPILLLNGTGQGPVNNLAVMSNVSPHYAPQGRHLIAASAPEAPSSASSAEVLRQMRSWFGSQVDGWRLVRADIVPKAQPRHLPGEAVPAKAALESGVFVAGDHRQNPSINGALQSGRVAARAVLDRLGTAPAGRSGVTGDTVTP